MSATLTQVSHEHHERLNRHIDAMPVAGDMVGMAPTAALRDRVDEMAEFLEGLLIPHLEAAEGSLYPEFERLLQNRHSMAPMRREHVEIRELVAGLGELRRHLDDGPLHTGETVALRRVIFRLYAMLKVHLAEEELYLGMLEQGASEEEVARLTAALEHRGITSF